MMMMKLPDAILYCFKKVAQQYLSQLSYRNKKTLTHVSAHC